MTLTPETLDFVRRHRTDDVRALALQAARYPDVDMRQAVTQIAVISSIWWKTLLSSFRRPMSSSEDRPAKVFPC